MGIREDAGELLLFAYKRYSEGEDLTEFQEFQKESGWDDIRIRNAFKYLQDRMLIKGSQYIGGGFVIERILPDGIDIIENQNNFKEIFGFKVNLGVISFSWNKEER